MGAVKRLGWLAALALWCLLFGGRAEAVAGTPLAPVQESKAVLSHEAVEAAARERLVSELQEDGEGRRYEIVTVRPPKDMKVPAGEIALDAVVPSGIRYGLTVPVYVTVSVDGQPYRQLACSFKVRVYDKVAVAARNLQPRRILQAKDVKLEERDVSLTGAHYLTDLERVVGRELSRLVREGTIFTAGMVKNPVIMPSGTVVVIISRYNGIEIRAEGKAMQAGREGSVIKVQNAATKKIIDARVVDAVTVETIRNH